jgi:hypothetical protein
MPTPTGTNAPESTATHTPITATSTPPEPYRARGYLPLVVRGDSNRHGTALQQSALMTKKLLVVILAGYGSLPVDGQARVEQFNTEAMALVRRASTYHGYLYETRLSADFLGQDGANYSGSGCSTGGSVIDAHIRISGLRTDATPIRFRVDDVTHAGVWATPCDPVTNWQLSVRNVSNGSADLYFEPFVNAPAGTLYRVEVGYADGNSRSTIVLGSAISP